jgi:hypothetical protein
VFDDDDAEFSLTWDGEDSTLDSFHFAVYHYLNDIVKVKDGKLILVGSGTCINLGDTFRFGASNA